MSSTQTLLRGDEGDPIAKTLLEVDKEVTDSMSMTRTIDSLIAHVWPTRRRRLTHDMIATNFINMTDHLLSYVQIILLLHVLDAAGRNWDHMSNINQVFLPYFVLLGSRLFIYLISFLWACFSFVSEGGDPRLLEFDELHRAVRLSFHSCPLLFQGLAILFFYAIVHCHLNNAHRSDGICQAFHLEVITVALSLLIAVILVHYMINFYQIFKHIQEPLRRRAFRSTLPDAAMPLLSGLTTAPRLPPMTPFALSRTNAGTGTGASANASANAITHLPDTAISQLPNTANSNYALGYE